MPGLIIAICNPKKQLSFLQGDEFLEAERNF
jgi:hypothetical protein